MKATAVFKALGPIDLRNVRRDEMLRWMVLIPLLLALLVRFGWPFMVTQIQTRFQFDLSPYVVMLMSYLVIGSPAVFGTVIGFLLLDERDEGSLIALQVTPMSLNQYVAYRLGLPILLTIVLLAISLPLAGITTFTFWELLLLAAVGCAPGTAACHLFSCLRYQQSARLCPDERGGHLLCCAVSCLLCGGGLGMGVWFIAHLLGTQALLDDQWRGGWHLVGGFGRHRLAACVDCGA